MTPRPSLRAVVSYVAVAALAVNIGLHAMLTGDHLQEMPYIGVLFIIGNVLLGAVLLLLCSSRTRLSGWLLGGVTCAGEAVAFVLSRTTGLPAGYRESWASTSEDYLGLICLFTDVVLVFAAVLALSRSMSTYDPERGAVGGPAMGAGDPLRA